MKYPIRYFSIGLFTASIVLLIGFYFFQPKSTLSEDETVDEMIGQIEKEGYRVISESEYISLATAKNELNHLQEDEDSANDKEKDDKKEKSDDQKKDDEDNSKDGNKKKDKPKDDKEKDDQKKDDVKKYTLVVEENMVPSTISEKLAENKIIKDAADFSKYMEDNDYSPYLQIGEFKLTSDMSNKEIAQTITGQ